MFVMPYSTRYEVAANLYSLIHDDKNIVLIIWYWSFNYWLLPLVLATLLVNLTYLILYDKQRRNISPKIQLHSSTFKSRTEFVSREGS